MDKEKRIKARMQAHYFKELTKGFNHPLTDNALRTANEFADYILEETQDIAEEAFQRMLNGIHG